MRRLRFMGDALKTPGAKLGLVFLGIVLAMIVLGPLLAPNPIDAPVGVAGTGPSGDALLGTDALGRDVLSRVLHGGLSVILISGAATIAAYFLGVLIGLSAGYSRSAADPVLMRGMDVLLAFPALLILLLLVGRLGSSVAILILGVVLVQIPGISRLVRTATMEICALPYVDAAVARGESRFAIWTREILPNLSPVILADVGVRFGYAIVLIASVNYLNLGLAPPAADWGLMLSENRSVISLNPFSVIAPAVMLGLLTLGVNLIADAVARSSGFSTRSMVEAVPAASEVLPGDGEPMVSVTELTDDSIKGLNQQ